MKFSIKGDHILAQGIASEFEFLQCGTLMRCLDFLWQHSDVQKFLQRKLRLLVRQDGFLFPILCFREVSNLRRTQFCFPEQIASPCVLAAFR